MTIDEAIRSDKVLLSTHDAGPILNMHPQTINLKAKNNDLPFPFIRSGNRTKIPRLPLLRWLGVEVLNETDVC